MRSCLPAALITALWLVPSSSTAADEPGLAYVLRPDDRVDPGQTQFYAMNGYLRRGDVLIGLVKILHDDWRAGGTPEGAYGVGYTALAWTRDGINWVRIFGAVFRARSAR
jgi:hypothetical protein